jgi:hypothetical protein
MTLQCHPHIQQVTANGILMLLQSRQALQGVTLRTITATD